MIIASLAAIIFAAIVGFLALFIIFTLGITIARAIAMHRHEKAARATGIPSGPYVPAREIRRARREIRANAQRHAARQLANEQIRAAATEKRVNEQIAAAAHEQRWGRGHK